MGRYNKYTPSFTAMADNGQSSFNRVTKSGARITKAHSDFGDDWKYAAAASGVVNTTTAVTIKAAAGAAVKNYLTALQINTETLGAATELVVRDGAGGTVLFRVKLATTAMPLQTIEFPTPIAGSANTLLEIATLTAVSGGVFVNAQGFVGP